MASISADKNNGHRTIQFVGADKRRRSIRLGKVSQRQAEAVKFRVEALLSSLLAGVPLDADTSAWVAGIGDDLRDKLAKAGLVAARQKADDTPTVAAYVAGYIAKREGAKVSTLMNLRCAEARLVAFAGTSKRLDEFTKADARDWLRTLVGMHAAATAGRTFRRGKQFFQDALDRELIRRNPFAGIKSPSDRNKARQRFVTPETARKVIDAGTDATWRLVIAMSRFGGLRIPSELVGMIWDDIFWDEGKMRVRSPKTEAHPGRAERWVPIYKELLPYLREAFEVAPDGAVRIFPGVRPETNLGQRLERTIARAGVTAWPKLFQNMRSSRQTELSAVYPITDVCAWMGNTPDGAADHYLQPLADSFRRATESGAESGAVVVQNPVQTTHDQKRPRRTGSAETLFDEGVSLLLSSVVADCLPASAPPVGLEPTTWRLTAARCYH